MLPKEILDKLIEKFEKYGTIENFLNKTKCPLSRETVRKALYEGKTLTPPILLLLIKYLGFTTKEMADILKQSGDKEFYPLLAENYISEKQKKFLRIFEILEDKDKLDSVLDYIAFVCKNKEVELLIRYIREA